MCNLAFDEEFQFVACDTELKQRKYMKENVKT